MLYVYIALVFLVVAMCIPILFVIGGGGLRTYEKKYPSNQKQETIRWR